MGLTLDVSKEDDTIEIREEIPFYLEQNLKPYLGEVYLDYEKSFWGEGVTIRSARGIAC